MVGVLVVGGSLGWIVHRAKVQRDAVRVIEKAGGRVRYDWQFRNGRMIASGEPRGPEWLTDRIGVDYFDTVTRVDLDRKVTDQVMIAVGNLPKVDTMFLNPSGLTDQGRRQLDRMSALRWLSSKVP
jgi:hypothetical protein